MGYHVHIYLCMSKLEYVLHKTLNSAEKILSDRTILTFPISMLE
ncbi:MAG: hypothetical protein ACTS8R_00215 [Arsenophonus sp. NC-QC1-MAG3]